MSPIFSYTQRSCVLQTRPCLSVIDPRFFSYGCHHDASVFTRLTLFQEFWKTAVFFLKHTHFNEVTLYSFFHFKLQPRGDDLIVLGKNKSGFCLSTTDFALLTASRFFPNLHKLVVGGSSDAIYVPLHRVLSSFSAVFSFLQWPSLYRLPSRFIKLSSFTVEWTALSEVFWY